MGKLSKTSLFHNKCFLLLLTILIGAIYFQSFRAAQIDPKNLVDDVSNVSTLVRSLLGPDLFLRTSSFPLVRPSPTLKLVVRKLWESISIGILATTFSSLIAVPLSLLAAKNVTGERAAGRAIYLLVRSILSVLRSVEPLVIAVVFSVWVGIGPFAGLLALTVHSIATLGKLYSEQIENIDMRPVNSILWAGIKKRYAVVYGIIPQALAPFIAHTIYRLDVNVRLSTVVGFVGGGGVGFLLIQWLNLFQFRKVATAIWAIAITIIVLDFISGKIRSNLLRARV